MMDTIDNTPCIMIVEDSDDDYEITVHAITKHAGFTGQICRCEDGQDLLDYIYKKGAYTEFKNWCEPDIIVLDLNMPGLDGRATLRALKGDNTKKHIPVIVLTTSNDERDIQACYRDGANTYIHKPVDLHRFCKTMQHMVTYWFEGAILPKDNAP